MTKQKSEIKSFTIVDSRPGMGAIVVEGSPEEGSVLDYLEFSNVEKVVVSFE